MRTNEDKFTFDHCRHQESWGSLMSRHRIYWLRGKKPLKKKFRKYLQTLVTKRAPTAYTDCDEGDKGSERQRGKSQREMLN